ncbi:HAMP domain-containing sensor histidine kinase [Caldifermentibacillus hisashii]|uniref:HAMP domain-containing sensor histidine kinase n=1 Tax=Caldifermentibacillus hisashii TaxID=996558 RepID=UPI003D20AC41
MKKDKTIKRDFYLLVVKVFLSTILSSAVTYLCLIYFIFMFTENNMIKPTDYFVKYLDVIEKKIEESAPDILNGELINLDQYSEKIEGEVLDINGNHLYGDQDVAGYKVKVGEVINREIVKGSYVYRFIPIKHDNAIQAVYVLKAPFGFIINNQDRLGIVLIYVVLLISPLIFFVIYLIFYTSKLYKSLFNNIKVLLQAADKISNGDFDFKISGLKRKEFMRIQDSFNTMIDALKEMIESISKIDDERKIMVSSIAHDIRTPLTVIQGQMDLINDLKDIEKFDITPHLDIIRKNCSKMSMLTDNLSLLYKVENVDFLLNIKRVDLGKMLHEKKQEISTMAHYKKNVHIHFDVHLSKRYYFLDEAMLMRVLDNILYNSLRFTTSGEIKLEVHDESDGHSSKIYFKCSDTGTGFKEKDTSQLFKAFYQDVQYKDHVGLGLYISKKIVNNFDGQIQAYNNENGGATVEFYIKEQSIICYQLSEKSSF